MLAFHFSSSSSKYVQWMRMNPNFWNSNIWNYLICSIQKQNSKSQILRNYQQIFINNRLKDNNLLRHYFQSNRLIFQVRFLTAFNEA